VHATLGDTEGFDVKLSEVEGLLQELTNCNADLHLACLRTKLLRTSASNESAEEPLVNPLNTETLEIEVPCAVQEGGRSIGNRVTFKVPQGDVGRVVEQVLLASYDNDQLQRDNEITFDQLKANRDLNVFGKRFVYTARQHDTHLRELVSL
jgi:hypothetical protein